MKKVLTLFALIFTAAQALAQSATVISANPPYSDAQAVAAAQAGITGFFNPNLAMPNGANLAHTIYGWASITGQTISTLTETSMFGSGGAGSQTLPAAAFFQNAQFEIEADGIGTTGLASVTTGTFKIKIGSNVIASAVTATWPANVSQIPIIFRANCTVLASGASGSLSCTGSIMVGSGLGSFTPSGTFLFTGTPATINLASGGIMDATLTLSSLVGSPTVKFYTARITQVN